MVESRLQKQLAGEESSFVQLMGYHSINMKLGALCAFMSATLMCLLVSNQQFRRTKKLIIALAAADTVNCFGIYLMGAHRQAMFGLQSCNASWEQSNCSPSTGEGDCIRGTVKIVGSPSVVSVEPSLIGSVAAPLSTCRTQPKNRRITSEVLLAVSAIFVVAVVGSGYIFAFVSRNNGNVKYFCGRKATFGKVLSSYIYVHNVVGYATGVLLNSLALRRVEFLSKKCSTDPRYEDRRILQIRTCLIVSSLSTVLVSIPNCLSIFSVLISSVQNRISKPAVWVTCLNSGVNLFVYLILDQEFRLRVCSLWSKELCSHIYGRCSADKEDEVLRCRSNDDSVSQSA